MWSDEHPDVWTERHFRAWWSRQVWRKFHLSLQPSRGWFRLLCRAYMRRFNRRWCTTEKKRKTVACLHQWSLWGLELYQPTRLHRSAYWHYRMAATQAIVWQAFTASELFRRCNRGKNNQIRSCIRQPAHKFSEMTRNVDLTWFQNEKESPIFDCARDPCFFIIRLAWDYELVLSV